MIIKVLKFNISIYEMKVLFLEWSLQDTIHIPIQDYLLSF